MPKDKYRTHVTDLLDAAEISYRVLPHSEPVYTVDGAAAQRGVIKEEMVKSILLRERKHRRFVMACVTGNSRLDPQAVRKYLPGNWKRLSFASAEEIHEVSDYTKGAIAPVGLPENIPVIFDESIARCTKVNISSGDHMAGLELDPKDLIHITNAIIAPIAEKETI